MLESHDSRQQEQDYAYRHLIEHYIDGKTTWPKLCQIIAQGEFIKHQIGHFKGLDQTLHILEDQVLPEAVKRQDWPQFSHFFLMAQNFRGLIESMQKKDVIRALGQQNHIELSQSIINSTPDPLKRLEARCWLMVGMTQHSTFETATLASIWQATLSEFKDLSNPNQPSQAQHYYQHLSSSQKALAQLKEFKALQPPYFGYLRLFDHYPKLQRALILEALILDLETLSFTTLSQKDSFWDLLLLIKNEPLNEVLALYHAISEHLSCKTYSIRCYQCIDNRLKSTLNNDCALYAPLKISLHLYSYPHGYPFDTQFILNQPHDIFRFCMEQKITSIWSILLELSPKALDEFYQTLNTIEQLTLDQQYFSSGLLKGCQALNRRLGRIDILNNAPQQWQLHLLYIDNYSDAQTQKTVLKRLQQNARLLEYAFKASQLVKLINKTAEIINPAAAWSLLLEMLYHPSTTTHSALKLIQALFTPQPLSASDAAVITSLLTQLLPHIEPIAAHIGETEGQGFQLRFDLYHTLFIHLAQLDPEQCNLDLAKEKLLNHEYQALTTAIFETLIRQLPHCKPLPLNHQKLIERTVQDTENPSIKFILELKLSQYLVSQHQKDQPALSADSLYQAFVNNKPVRQAIIELWTLVDNPDDIYKRINQDLSQDTLSPKPQALLNVIEHALIRAQQGPAKKQQTQQLIHILQNVFYEPDRKLWLSYVPSLIRMAQFKSNHNLSLEYGVALSKCLDSDLLIRYPNEVFQTFCQLILSLPRWLNITHKRHQLAILKRLYRLAGDLLSRYALSHEPPLAIKNYLDAMKSVLLMTIEQVNEQVPTQLEASYWPRWTHKYLSLQTLKRKLLHTFKTGQPPTTALFEGDTYQIKSKNPLHWPIIRYLIQYQGDITYLSDDALNHLNSDQSQESEHIKLWQRYWQAKQAVDAYATDSDPTLVSQSMTQAINTYSELLDQGSIAFHDPQYMPFIHLIWQTALAKIVISDQEVEKTLDTFLAQRTLNHIKANPTLSQHYYILWLSSRARPVLGTISADKRQSLFNNLTKAFNKSQHIGVKYG